MQAAIDKHRAIGREGYLYGRRSVCQQHTRPLLFCGIMQALERQVTDKALIPFQISPHIPRMRLLM